MAQEFAKPFYNSKAWIDCRQRYIRQIPINRRGLCERCYKEGKHEIGEEVHHKVWLNPKNINDPCITLSFKNLEYLCHECHTREHLGNKEPKRYEFDAAGNLIPKQ